MKEFLKKIGVILVLLGLYILVISAEELVAGGILRGLPAAVGLVAVQILAVSFYVIYAQRKGLLDLNWQSWFGLRALKVAAIGYAAMFLLRLPVGIWMTMEGQQTTANQAAVNELISQAPPVISFLMIVVVAPVIEEIICRGFIPNLLPEKYAVWGQGLGVLGFAALHQMAGYSLGSLLIYAVMGLTLAGVQLKTQKLEYSILTHSLNNLVALAWLLLL